MPGGMAFGAVLEVGNALLTMLGLDLSRIVLVAGIAIVGAQTARVAYLAITEPAFTVIEREGMRAVKERRHPGAGVVAGKAIVAKQPQVIAWLCVASGTLLRRSAEDVVGMALGTRHSLMGSR